MMNIAYSPIIPLNLEIYPIFDLFSFFGFPYFDHDAFTHHAKHVLDAPVGHASLKLIYEIMYFTFGIGVIHEFI